MIEEDIESKTSKQFMLDRPSCKQIAGQKRERERRKTENGISIGRRRRQEEEEEEEEDKEEKGGGAGGMK